MYTKDRFLRALLISFLITACLALPTSSSAPLPPSQDPWYTPPNNFASSSPGEILRLRKAPGNLTSVFSNSSAAYNILYRTTNAHYEPSWAVTTLFIPKTGNDSALLSYQIPYNSADVDSGPSYALYTPPSPLSALINSDIQTALGFGWHVNVPDFEGPLASFGEGVQEGHAVLDSVRAGLNPRFGLATDAHYALWGYSGGSIASEWAAELQVQYAPELKFAGVAAGGLVPNVTSVVPAATGTMWAGLIPEALIGILSQYPKAYNYMLSQLKTEGPYNQTAFLAAKQMSIEQAFVTYYDQDIYDYFKPGESFFDAPIVRQVFDVQGQEGYHGVPQMPLFFYKAIADELSPVNETDALVDRYCSVGANILYERNTIGGHLAEETNGDQRALEWLNSVLSGAYIHSGCTIKNVAINVTDSPL